MESAKVTKKVVKSSTKAQESSQVASNMETTVTKKTKASTVASTASPAAVQTPTTEMPTVVTKKTKVSTSKQVEAPSTDTPTVSTAVPTDSAAQTEATSTPSVHDELEALANDMIKTAKRFLELSRQAKKEHSRQVKKAEQGSGRRRQRKAEGGESSHSNSVFLQPCKVSDQLATFCGVSSDSMISRTDATRKIAAYIKENNLQNPENRREIQADATLTSLFSLTSEDKLNYFNLQRYIKPHFIKDIKV
jgi:chromatin remodeling complex protein RSC6